MNGSTKSDNVSTGLGLVLVMLGVLFLLEQVFGFDLGPWLWPLFIIIPGLLFFVGMVLGGRSSGALAIPGSIVTMIGLILLYQNTFDHYESWAYAWALIPFAAGIGMLIGGTWGANPAMVQHGRRTAGIGLVLFLIGFFFFELMLNIGGFSGGIAWPLLLIAGGIYLLLRQVGFRRRQASADLAATDTVAQAAPDRDATGTSTSLEGVAAARLPATEGTPSIEPLASEPDEAEVIAHEEAVRN